MEQNIVYALAGLIGLMAAAAILVQLLKGLLGSKKDENDVEVGPRKWLPIIVMLVMIALGLTVGFVRRDYEGDEGALYMFAWGMAGFVIAAGAAGLYDNLAVLFPSVFNSSSWLKRMRGGDG